MVAIHLSSNLNPDSFLSETAWIYRWIKYYGEKRWYMNFMAAYISSVTVNVLIRYKLQVLWPQDQGQIHCPELCPYQPSYEWLNLKGGGTLLTLYKWVFAVELSVEALSLWSECRYLRWGCRGTWSVISDPHTLLPSQQR